RLVDQLRQSRVLVGSHAIVRRLALGALEQPLDTPLPAIATGEPACRAILEAATNVPFGCAESQPDSSAASGRCACQPGIERLVKRSGGNELAVRDRDGRGCSAAPDQITNQQAERERCGHCRPLRYPEQGAPHLAPGGPRAEIDDFRRSKVWRWHPSLDYRVEGILQT